MIIKFGMYEKIFRKRVLNIARKNLVENYEYETVSYLTKEEQNNCYLEVIEMDLMKVIARVVSLEDGSTLCDDIYALIDTDLFE